MENNIVEIIKKAVIEYAKAHNEDIGKVTDIFNHLDEAIRISKTLSPQLSHALNEVVCDTLIANGISHVFFRKQ